MGSRYSVYQEYKDSGVEWLESVPSHWSVDKLKFMAIVQPSNVDKKKKAGELPVLLCNYTDVYYNQVIDKHLDYMRATATDDQIEKFTLKAGDTIITKDSEDPNDIAVPAYVSTDLVGVVCGYHLSMIRPFEKIKGKYIKRVFECGYAKAYFSTRSNGLTRYGLGSYALSNVYYPNPPGEEANKIANFLDHETAKIDTLIEKQQQLIKLLKEKRQAVISHAVTKGLNTDAPMRDSGVEWFSEVPSHWVVSKLKFLTSQIVDGAHFTPTYTAEGVPFLRVSDIHGKTIEKNNIKYIPEDEHQKLIERCCPEYGDLLLSKNGTIGVPKIVDWRWEFSIFVSLCLIKLNKKLDIRYAYYFFLTYEIREQISGLVKQSTVINLHLDKIENFVLTLPPVTEQKNISAYLDEELNRYDLQINKAGELETLLLERRAAIISAAVTGKIDVRNWQSPTPAKAQSNKEATP